MPNPGTDTNTLAPKKSKLQSTIDYFKANIDSEANSKLALGKALLVIPTQPIQVIMRYQQAALAFDPPRVLSIPKAYKEISASGSLNTFFKGWELGAGKELAKNFFYKGALIVKAPSLAESVLPQATKNYTSDVQYNLVKCIVAGCIASISDATLGGGVDRIATYLTTAQGKNVKASFSNEFSQQKTALGKIRFVYKGFGENAIKGSFAFSTMFFVAQPIRHWTASFYNHSTKEAAPWYSAGTAAVLAGIAVAIMSSPWDILKTQKQMPGSQDKKPLRALMDNVSTHGWRGATAGLPAKTVMIILGWSLNSFFKQKMDELEERRAQNKDHLSPTN